MQLDPTHGAVMMRMSMFGRNPALGDVKDLRARWSRCPLRTRAAFAAGLAGQSMAGEPSRGAVPVTIVRGTRDRVSPAQRSGLMHDRLPCAELGRLPSLDPTRASC